MIKPQWHTSKWKAANVDNKTLVTNDDYSYDRKIFENSVKVKGFMTTTTPLIRRLLTAMCVMKN